MQRLIVFIISLVILYTCSAFAGETGKLAGKVTDKETGQPLLGATVVVVSRWVEGSEEKLKYPLGASTNQNGEYFIINIPPGSYNIRLTSIGYKQEVILKTEINVDKTTRLDVKMISTVIVGQEVIVTAYNPQKIEIDLTATKQTYDIENIRGIAGVSNISDILDLQPDVIDDHFRGGRVGQSQYLIGGSSINNPLTNSKSFNPIISGFQQVEVYTSGFSAEYGNAQSGVINMVSKEGGEKWRTSIEAAALPPYYKTFGGSVYSPSNMYFYNTLLDLNEWLKDNPTKPGSPLFDQGSSFLSTYLPKNLSDTLKLARIGQLLWLQSVHDVGLKYNNTVDSRLDFTIGGPLLSNLKVFIAGRQETTNPIVPTPQPNVDRQVMSNFTYQPDEKNNFGFRFNYDYNFSNILSSNWLWWIFDRTLAVSKTSLFTQQYNLDWKHIFSPSIIMDLGLNNLNNLQQDRIDLIAPGGYIQDYAAHTNWIDYTGPSGDRIGHPEDSYGDQRITTWNMNGNINAQINNLNLLKAGFQFTYYNIDVNENMNVSDAGSYRKLLFNVFPYEGAFFAQDKIEFEGLIANIGLRLDYYDMNSTYYSDIFSPLRNPYYDSTKQYLERGPYYDQNLALKTRTSLYAKLQPRIGFSFPVNEFTVLHLNYGTFTQRPNFNQIFYNQVTSFNEIAILGNPRLKPENTKTYDIGVVSALPYGLKLDLSAYYKDVKDLVETAYFYDDLQNVYQTYVNRDYSDIKGFNVILEKQDGPLTGTIRYNYESATGVSSNDLNAPVSYFENPAPNQSSVVLPSPEDVYMDYDRTHKAVMNVRYQFDNEEGPSLFGFYPFENLSINTTFRIMSGRPFTFDETGQGLKYNQRAPAEHDLRIRVEKLFSMKGASFTFYVEGFNLLNEIVYDYTSVFNDPRNTLKWVKTPENILVYDLYSPYNTSQAVDVISNQPIHFRVGVICRF
ncbi:MAG: TonB-dependent receptor [Ignavibacteriaceae bacterium]|nr:TonB-dependent receptor [Ignavibacteriaceae bacterium]